MVLFQILDQTDTNRMKFTNQNAIIILAVLLVIIVSAILIQLGLIDVTITIVSLCALSIGVLAGYFIHRNKSKSNVSTTSNKRPVQTRKLVTDTLQRMNCQVEEDAQPGDNPGADRADQGASQVSGDPVHPGRGGGNPDARAEGS